MLKQWLKFFFLLVLVSGTTVAKEPETLVVKERAVGTVVTLGGTVIPYKEVTLAAQIPGRVEYIAGEEGDRFAEETVLVQIDDTELRAKRRAAEAQLAKADTALRNANIQYSRQLWSPNSPKNSAPGGMGLPHMFDQFFTKPMSDVLGQSDSDLDRHAELHSYGTRIDQARSAYLQARSQIEQIDAKLRDARSKAPFNGVITNKMKEEGETVQPGQPLLKFADTQYLQIEVEVPARLTPALEKGMEVPAKLDVWDTPLIAKVAQIFPIADPQHHTVTVKFDIPIGTRTSPGQYAEVEIQDITVDPTNLIIIPKKAVVWRGSLPGVYVLKKAEGQQRQELRLLRLGKDIGQDKISVLSGLDAGDEIILEPQPGISSGWITKPSNSSTHN